MALILRTFTNQFLMFFAAATRTRCRWSCVWPRTYKQILTLQYRVFPWQVTVIQIIKKLPVVMEPKQLIKTACKWTLSW